VKAFAIIGVITRYRGTGKRLYFRGDAAFANPEMYEFLEAGRASHRVGFIVTNLARPVERVVAFYNQRGTCEQFIKEGKDTAVMPDLRRQRRPPPTSWVGLQPG
jgi:hypothetical protein